MKIKIQNKDIKMVKDFLLNDITAKGTKNISRMRIVKVLDQRHKEVGEEELTLIKEFGKTDDDNELILNEQGGVQMEDFKEFQKQQEALYDEYFIIKGENLESSLKTVEKLINEFNNELSGKSAEAHFILVEAFENKVQGDEE